MAKKVIIRGIWDDVRIDMNWREKYFMPTKTDWHVTTSTENDLSPRPLINEIKGLLRKARRDALRYAIDNPGQVYGYVLWRTKYANKTLNDLAMYGKSSVSDEQIKSELPQINRNAQRIFRIQKAARLL